MLLYEYAISNENKRRTVWTLSLERRLNSKGQARVRAEVVSVGDLPTMRFWTGVNTNSASRLISNESLTAVYSDIWRRLVGSRNGAIPKQHSKKEASLAEAEEAMFRIVQQPLEHRMTEIKPTWTRRATKPCYISSVSTNFEDTESTKPDLVLIHGCNYHWRLYCCIVSCINKRCETDGGGKGIWIRNIDELSKVSSAWKYNCRMGGLERTLTWIVRIALQSTRHWLAWLGKIN